MSALWDWTETCPYCGVEGGLLHKPARSYAYDDAHVVKCLSCKAYMHMTDYANRSELKSEGEQC